MGMVLEFAAFGWLYCLEQAVLEDQIPCLGNTTTRQGMGPTDDCKFKTRQDGTRSIDEIGRVFYLVTFLRLGTEDESSQHGSIKSWFSKMTDR